MTGFEFLMLNSRLQALTGRVAALESSEAHRSAILHHMKTHRARQSIRRKLGVARDPVAEARAHRAAIEAACRSATLAELVQIEAREYRAGRYSFADIARAEYDNR